MPVERLTLEQIRERDTALEADTALSPFQLKPGVVSRNMIAVAGIDGFLFITNGANRWERQYLGDLRAEPSWAPGWIALLHRRREEAMRRGVTLLNVVVPEKQSVLPEYRWPSPLPDAGNRPLRVLLDALGGDPEIFYLADALIEAKQFAPTYFRHNSHWTASGCCHAMAGLLRGAGVIDIPADLAFAYRAVNVAQDLPPHFFERPPLGATAFLDPAGTYLFEHRPYESTGRLSGTRYAVSNPDAIDDRRVLIFGDSFSYDMGLAAFMSAIFRETIFIWSKDVEWSEVDAHRPDIVLWESAERFLVTIPQS